MKKILAIVITAAMLVSLLAVGIFAVSAEEETESEWKTFWLTHYDDDSREGAGVVFSTAFYKPYWRCYGFKPVDGTDHTYEIAALETADEKGSKVAVPEGGFVIAFNTGNNWPQLVADNNVKGDGATGLWYDDAEHVAKPNYVSAGITAMWSEIANWKVGDQYEIVGLDLEGKTVPTSTTDKEWYEEGYVCDAKFRPYDAGKGEEDPNAGSEPSEPTTVPEEITVDGKVDDNGWTEEGWTEVTTENGTVQETDTGDDALSYKFQMRTDDEKLYVAFVIDAALVKSPNADANKGACTNVRLWIHNDEEYAQYTHFFDVWMGSDDQPKTLAKYNQSKEANSGANIENSTLTGAVAEVDGKTVIELSVAISEFAKEGQTKVGFFANVANTVTKQFTLLYPQFPIGETDHNENMPYKKWFTEGEGVIDLEAIKLGEITVEPGVPSGDNSEDEGDEYEEKIKANMGDENQDPKFEVTLTGPETITEGETFEVVATVNKVVQGTELAQISFNLGFDADALELMNQANNENVVNVDATVPDAWENLTKLGESAGLLEVNFTNATDATSVITEDGKLVITFKFKAKEGVEKAGLWIDHESVASNDPNFNDFAGNGTYLILNAAGETSTEDSSAESAASSAVQTGDGSVNVIVLAIIALVAVAGCAVVIKTRR